MGLVFAASMACGGSVGSVGDDAMAGDADAVSDGRDAASDGDAAKESVDGAACGPVHCIAGSMLESDNCGTRSCAGTGRPCGPTCK